MPTAKQLAANRRNAQKSTGPRTPEGKAVSRFNALKSGIRAAAEVLPSELNDDLKALTDLFYQQFQPATPEECCLVDLVIRNEWQLRRAAAVEAHYWNLKRRRHFEGGTPVDDREAIGRDYTRLQWRLNSLQRNLLEALDRLRAVQAARQTAEPEAFNPELGSFGSDTEAPAGNPDPEPAVPTSILAPNPSINIINADPLLH